MVLEQWAGLNQLVPRHSIDDEELYWNENLFPIGPGSLRACWGHGPVLYTAPAGTTILRIFFGFYGNQTPPFGWPPPGRMGWMFLSNGNIDEVDLDTLQVTTIPGAWAPIGPQYWASAKVWRPRWIGNTPGEAGGVLFGSPGGLYAWDGTTLYAPGAPAPDWFTSADISGLGPFTMPTGLPGIYTMEVYQERLFVAGKNVIAYSAPQNGADFSASGGGGAFGYFGDKLVYSYMDLSAAAGYLFCFGDSSTDMISNVQLTGAGTVASPYSTVFNYQNVDPQIGHAFPRPVGHWGRYFVIGNGAPLHPPDTDPLAHRGSVYLMFGGDAQVIGEKITRLYTTLENTDFQPTICPATIFGFRVMLLNAMFTDPFGVRRPLILMWHGNLRGKEIWSVASQNLSLTHIGSYEQDSVITPYGTDGQSLYQLFANPDPALPKRFSTKAYKGSGIQGLTIKTWKRLYLEVTDYSGDGAAFNGIITTTGGGIPNGRQDVAFQIAQGELYRLDPAQISGQGLSGQLDMISYSPDFTIERLFVGKEDRTLYGA
jgi:hypothetical protein